MPFDSQHSFLSVSDSSGQSSSTKRAREDEPVRYAVSLQETPGAVMQVLNLDTSANISHISQWNEQLVSLICNVQERISALSAAPEPIEQQPTDTIISQPHISREQASSCSSTLALAESHDTKQFSSGYEPDQRYKSDSDESCLSDKAPRIPISQRLGYTAELQLVTSHAPLTRSITGVFTTKSGRRSTTCKSDSEHGLRRVYTMGLMKPKNCSLRQYLAGIGIDPAGIVFSHHVAYTVNELIVKVDSVQALCRDLGRADGVKVLRFFDPLRPVHSELSSEQKQAFPGIYKKRLRATFSPTYSSRIGFGDYARAYTREIGIDI